jgi:acyl-CoA hydrolase
MNTVFKEKQNVNGFVFGGECLEHCEVKGGMNA